MKKTYINPVTECMELKSEMTLLNSSPAGTAVTSQSADNTLEVLSRETPGFDLWEDEE